MHTLLYAGFAFSWQVLTYHGFYDDNLEFVGLEGVQIVASMNGGSAMGRHLLTTRFTSIVRICSVRCCWACFTSVVHYNVML